MIFPWVIFVHLIFIGLYECQEKADLLRSHKQMLLIEYQVPLSRRGKTLYKTRHKDRR